MRSGYEHQFPFKLLLTKSQRNIHVITPLGFFASSKIPIGIDITTNSTF